MRLAAAREMKRLTQEQVGSRFGVGKGTVSAWETGRGDPGVFRLRELAKLYGVSADALLWDSAPSVEAMQFAAQFDGLSDRQQRAFRAMWLAYFHEASSDADVAQHLPGVPVHEKSH